MKTLVLASQSPRRSELLKKAGFQFEVRPAYVSEIPQKNLSLDEQILKIARDKGLAAVRALPPDLTNALILSADTMVCIDNEALGKPANEFDAFQTLRRLSGRDHQVKTAMFLFDQFSKSEVSHIETTQIRFRNLTDQEIKKYIETGEPMDKAGSYAIQGGARDFVIRIDGDYDNVVGLPVQALIKILEFKNWKTR